jgi:hypothetical protein
MGSSAQGIINSQVADKCDLLVGVFWTRIGTATDNYMSGAVEEIERHMDTGKPAMLYFSSQPVAIETVDLEQVTRLKEFKDSCRQRGLYESYDSHTVFKSKFYRQLQLKLNEHPLFLRDGVQLTSNSVTESKTKIPAMSVEARTLLKEASLDAHGSILYVRYLAGTDLQTNGRNIIPSDQRREVAKWGQALNELAGLNLIIERGQKGEVFEVTNLGYQIAEMIAL